MENTNQYFTSIIFFLERNLYGYLVRSLKSNFIKTSLEMNSQISLAMVLALCLSNAAQRGFGKKNVTLDGVLSDIRERVKQPGGEDFLRKLISSFKMMNSITASESSSDGPSAISQPTTKKTPAKTSATTQPATSKTTAKETPTKTSATTQPVTSQTTAKETPSKTSATTQPVTTQTTTNPPEGEKDLTTKSQSSRLLHHTGNFPVFFMLILVVVVAVYFAYHNKTKIHRFIKEGYGKAKQTGTAYVKVKLEDDIELPREANRQYVY